MSRVQQLLEPIAGDHAAGPDLSDGDEYARIERAYHEADLQPAVSPGGVVEEADTDFAEVVELATEFLEERSKDLKIAVLLAAALLREEGFSGLADGLDVLNGLLERYWEELHPGVAGRAAVLEWLGSDDVAYAVYLARFSEMGHTYHHYREWAKREADSAEGEGGGEPGRTELSADNFTQGFAETSRAWYDELCSSLERAAAALETLDTAGREKFSEAEERPPSYKDLASALKRVTTGAQDLLSRKPAPAPSETPAAGAPDATEGEEGEAPSGGPAAVGAEPGTPEEAAAAVAASARVLRHADPGNPAPYLLLRGFRWGELRAMGDHPDPRALVAPRTDQRTRLKGLFLDQAWETLLEEAEGIMATPAGRGWLDLQRYTVVSAERLGSEYRRVAAAVKGAVRELIVDLPALVRSTLMDDSATASPDTMAWFESQGLIEGGEAAGSPEASDTDVEAEAMILRASFDRAAGLVRGGDPQGAVELLMNRAEHERSERARFLVKAEAAAIMVGHGMEAVARPILDQLHEQINAHKLEEWERGDTVARPLGLLYRCLAATDGALREQLYTRLAKLDPLLAMQVREGPDASGVGDGQGGAGQDQGGGQAGGAAQGGGAGAAVG